MEARQNNNPVDPIEAQNQGAEVPPPPSKKVPTQYVAIGAVLAAGGRPAPDEPPTLDPGSERGYWGRYPVAFPT